ncbi:serine/arginine-rich splicing factor SR45a isoform X2 [Physcomitrium patens]|uniref:RRM domain-containing protein n=1 Tax=Physcomitrium patens TaxID=3218 RepID=A0A7I4BRK5_PHYPA|nr:serine/arginine-rich splicing factor SR45a-like isoform X2 [Physcomitrium patens]|eukprot:XP_024389726.1 serine/arginine-rich splicing factor SR45a-like isoform X2 [Physcomitrella patens]
MDSPRGRSRTPPYRYSDSPSPRRSSRGRSRSRTPPSRRDRSDVREDATNPGNNLYVTGLSTRVTEKDLDEHFSREGKVVECRLVVDPRTRESRGFGFVTMDNADDADRCVKYLNRSTLEGRIITVEKAKRKRARTPTPGEYLGVRAAVQAHSRGYGGDYGGRNGGRDSYSDRRAPRYSPYRGRDGRDRERSPRHSPYRGYRRERSRSPRYSPYRR